MIRRLQARLLTISAALAFIACSAEDYQQSLTKYNEENEFSFLYPGGDISDELGSCTVEELEHANDVQLHAILQELVNTTFFRTFLVDLDHGCPITDFGIGKSSDDGHGRNEDSTTVSKSSSDFTFGEEKDEEFQCDGGKEELDEDAPPLCTVAAEEDNNLFGGSGTPSFFSSSALGNIQEQSAWSSESQEKTFSWKETTHPVIMGSDSESGEELNSCDDQGTLQQILPDSTFWLDMCSQIKEGDGAKIVNLALNPERNTAYNGTHIWNAIYEENCIEFDGDDHSMCFEEKVLYRLLSGLHTSTTLSIATNYYPPSKRKGRDSWEPNAKYFMEKFAGHPEYIQNLHFSYVVLLRALRRASGYLEDYTISTGNIVDDGAASALIKRLLDTHILNSCSSVFSAFDETLMFESAVANEGYSLQENFKGVFHNVSSILDCVQCQQCKLHGKMAMLGYGTALKILLTPEGDLLSNNGLSRNEIVAFVNTLAKFSESMKEVRHLSHLYFMESEKFAKELPIPDPKQDEIEHWSDKSMFENEYEQNKAMDIAVAAISKLARKNWISESRESNLLFRALNKDPALLVLAKYYGSNIEKFRQYSNHIEEEYNPGEVSSSPDQPDAIIVGSGLAGLTATLKILDRGGSVVLVEKEHRIGGNSAKASSGINACCPNNDMYDDSIKSFEYDTIRSAGNSANLPLIQTLVNKSADAVAFLKNRTGVDLSLLAQLGGHSHKRTHRPSDGMAGAEIIFAMQKAIKKFENTGKLKIMMDTKVTGLLQENGTVIGLEYISLDKDDENLSSLKAPNVILATGGFASDRTQGSYLEKHRPELMGFSTTAGDFSTGDGITLGTQMGAGTVDLDKVQIHPTGWVDPADEFNPSKILAAELMRGVGGILLNDSGARFCNELGTRAYVTDMMLKHESKYMNNGKWNVDAEVPTFSLVLASSAATDGKKHVDLYSHKGLLTKLKGIQELANWLQKDVEVIQSTLLGYIEDAEKGKDIWGKISFRGMPSRDLENEIFYAGKVTPVLHYCMGGIKIDTRGSVLDESSNPIPGLHAAGEVSGGVHGSNRLGGNSLLECTVFGSIVGEKIPIKSRGESQDIKHNSKRKLQTGANHPVSPTEITLEELAQHNSANDCWVAIHGDVYDLTEFAEEHPPGAESIYVLAGKEATDAFKAVHSRGLLEDFANDKVGVLV